MIHEFLPTDWDRIFCHPDRWRLVCRLLTGEVAHEYLQLKNRSVRIIVDSTVPMNGLLIGNSTRVIPFYGLVDTVQNVRDNKGDFHGNRNTKRNRD